MDPADLDRPARLETVTTILGSIALGCLGAAAVAGVAWLAVQVYRHRLPHIVVEVIRVPDYVDGAEAR